MPGGQLGCYQCIKTLGKGNFGKVKESVSTQDGQTYAVKLISPEIANEDLQQIQTEVQAMEYLQAQQGTQNVIKIVEKGNGTYKKATKQREVFFIVMEYAGGGQLMEFLMIGERFSERVSRYFFREFLNGLEIVHRNGIAHRDLKPENIMLDDTYNLKIIDFGFAGALGGKTGQKIMSTPCGTPYFMAPEIQSRSPYVGEQVDIFAAGVILFMINAKNPPFNQAVEADPFYKMIAKDRADFFWSTHIKYSQQAGDEYNFSQDLMELIQSMIQQEPIHRPTMSQILCHPWVTNPDVATKEEIIAEFQAKQIAVNQQLQAEIEEKKKDKLKQEQIAKYSNGIVRKPQPEEVNRGAPSKPIEEYVKRKMLNTEFFSTCNPDIIEHYLGTYIKEQGQYLKDEKEDLKFSKEKYKVKFNWTTKGQDGVEEMTMMCVRILKVPDQEQKYCVEFTKIAGKLMTFNSHYKQIKTELDWANDTTLEAEDIIEQQEQQQEEQKEEAKE